MEKEELRGDQGCGERVFSDQKHLLVKARTGSQGGRKHPVKAVGRCLAGVPR